jgi:hypothetical protein
VARFILLRGTAISRGPCFLRALGRLLSASQAAWTCLLRPILSLTQSLIHERWSSDWISVEQAGDHKPATKLAITICEVSQYFSALVVLTSQRRSCWMLNPLVLTIM